MLLNLTDYNLQLAYQKVLQNHCKSGLGALESLMSYQGCAGVALGRFDY